MSISSTIASDRLAELRNKKKIAIHVLDFDTAEEFDRQLREQNEQITADLISRIYNDILKEVQDQIRKYNGIQSDIAQFQAREEAHVNTTYRDLFEKARIQHEMKLRDVDKSHGIALLRESERKIPAQLSLLEQAKAAAVAVGLATPGSCERRRAMWNSRRGGTAWIDPDQCAGRHDGQTAAEVRRGNDRLARAGEGAKGQGAAKVRRRR
jgi:hypothetical protein